MPRLWKRTTTADGADSLDAGQDRNVTIPEQSTTSPEVPQVSAPSKSELKRAKKQAKLDAKAYKKGEQGRVTPGNAKKFIAVAKVVGPALAPLALRAVAAAREGLDRMQARRLGVPVDDLARFSGKGAALHARIAGDADALHDVRARAAGRTDEQSRAEDAFADAAERQLAQLSSAVHAAERMPTPRRRAAHRAVAGELSRIEDDLLHRLGI